MKYMSAKETTEVFYLNNIEVVIDMRLNNTLHLVSFIKYSDIQYFLFKLVDYEYNLIKL